jgi:glycerol-3-phosphate dehydrogenase
MNIGHSNSTFDVAIIGGGVVGCAIARELSRYKLSIVLLEKNAETAFGTTKTNSGIIHPGHDTSLDTLKGRLVVKGNAMFDQLQDELGFGFSRIGELNVARTHEEIAGLEEMKRRGEEKGVPGLEMWDQERLRREEPNLSRSIVAALYAPSAGVINPYEFAFALIESAINNGVELRVDCPVTAISSTANGLTLSTSNGTVQSRYVINCAGVYSDKIAEMIGCCDFKIIPRKGEEYMLDKRLKGLVRHLIFPLPTKTTKGTLIIPTFDGTIMVGPTAEDVTDREDFSTSSKGAKQVFEFVRTLCPSVDSRDAITAFAGLRAVADSGDFIIGPTKVKGFINVAGIQSPGLTSAPSIAEYVRDILKSEGLKLAAKKGFNPRIKGPPRFALLSPEEQANKVAEDPRFAKVVCRCEMITEAEIHDSITHGARTLDGIKFRSRAGMGRCQGGFCTSRCIDILSQRLGIPIEEITKNGEGSWLISPMEDGHKGH